MAGAKWGQKIQIGKETTASGTAIAATNVLRGDGGTISDDHDLVFISERVGVTTPSIRTMTPKLLASLDMAATPATFEQLPYIGEAGIGVETPTQDGSGSDYIYAYTIPYNAVNTLATYTLECGDNQQAEEMEYGFVESFKLSGGGGEAVIMSAKWIGRQVTKTSFTGSVAVPTVEEILSTGEFYIDAIGGSIGSTAIEATLLSWELSVDTGWGPKFTADSGQKYFQSLHWSADRFKGELKVTMEHNASAVAQKDAWIAETPKLVRLLIEGSDVTTAGTTYSAKTLILDMVGKWEKFEPLGDEDGNSTYDATFKIGWDEGASTTNPFTMTVVNELSALT